MSLKSKLDEMIARQVKSILNEASIPQPFQKLFKAFPRDAKSWKDATDEIRDVARMAREVYNEIQLDLTEPEVEDEGKGIQALNFRSFKTPSEWNSKAQDFIVMVYNKMNPEAKREFLRQAKTYIGGNYF